MAIAKMQKVSIVTAPSNKDHLLYTLQTMQNIQVSDLSLKVTGQDFTFNNKYKAYIHKIIGAEAQIIQNPSDIILLTDDGSAVCI